MEELKKQKTTVVPGSSGVQPLGGGVVGKPDPAMDAAVKQNMSQFSELQKKAIDAGISREMAMRTNPRQLQLLINQREKVNAARENQAAPGKNDQTQIDGAKAMIELASHGSTKSSTGSIYTHDHITHGLLGQMIEVLKAQGGSYGDVLQAQIGGGGQGGGQGRTMLGEGLGEVVQRFSKGLDQLAVFMGNPLAITVGGNITMDVNLNGAEWFRDAEGSLTQMAGKQITTGINNFIRHGLKDARVNTKDNWVGDNLDGVGAPMGSNPHSNTA